MYPSAKEEGYFFCAANLNLAGEFEPGADGAEIENLRSAIKLIF